MIPSLRGDVVLERILVLPPLGSDSFDLFSTKLTQLAGQTRHRILHYRIGLAWGATGGYARAIEIFVEYMAGMVMKVIENFQIQNLALPPKFTPDELESLLLMWEQRGPTKILTEVLERFPEATYRGSVLVDTVEINDSMFYLPTVAPWHVALQGERASHCGQRYG